MGQECRLTSVLYRLLLVSMEENSLAPDSSYQICILYKAHGSSKDSFRSCSQQMTDRWSIMIQLTWSVWYIYDTRRTCEDRSVGSGIYWGRFTKSRLSSSWSTWPLNITTLLSSHIDSVQIPCLCHIQSWVRFVSCITSIAPLILSCWCTWKSSNRALVMMYLGLNNVWRYGPSKFWAIEA